MRFILGLLVGYCIRGRQRLLIGTLTAIAIVVFVVLPAIALSLLALDVRRERLSRPPQIDSNGSLLTVSNIVNHTRFG